MADQNITLGLDIQGGGLVEQLRQRLGQTKQEMAGLAEQFARGEVTAEQFDRQVVALSNSHARLGTVLNRVQGEQGGFKSLQQSIMATGYAFQDFTSTSGDLGQKLNSIANNLQGILSVIPQFAPYIAGIGVALIAVYRNWEYIQRAIEGHPFQRAADDIEGMKKELTKADTEMKKLGESTTLTQTEIARYNQLRLRTAQLEKQIADEQERQARYKVVTQGPTPETAERRQQVQEAIQGQGRAFEQDLTRALLPDVARQNLQQFMRQRDEAMQRAQLLARPEDVARAQTEIQAEFQKHEQGILHGYTEMARKLLDDLLAGSEDAQRRVRDIISRNAKLFGNIEGIEKFFALSKKEQEETNRVLDEAAERRKLELEGQRRIMEDRLKRGIGNVTVERPTLWGELPTVFPAGRVPTPAPPTPPPAPQPAPQRRPQTIAPGVMPGGGGGIQYTREGPVVQPGPEIMGPAESGGLTPVEAGPAEEPTPAVPTGRTVADRLVRARERRQARTRRQNLRRKQRQDRLAARRRRLHDLNVRREQARQAAESREAAQAAGREGGFFAEGEGERLPAGIRSPIEAIARARAAAPAIPGRPLPLGPIPAAWQEIGAGERMPAGARGPREAIDLARRGNGAVAATQQAMAETQSVVQMIAVQQEALIRQALGLSRNAQRIRARTQSALPSQIGGSG